MFYAITVTDNGKGIEEESLEKLFDPFYTTKQEGTGLGLSICYGIIHRHRGSIDIGNRSGGGAQVVIQLPIGFKES
jgi:signal transduction histidine kinase